MKIKEKWKESILRNVVPTSDFSIPSEENIGDTHKKLAKTKRQTGNIEGAAQLMIEGGAGMAQSSDTQELLKVEDLSIFGTGQVHPIIFEECYVKDSDPRFV